jgi:hypothetical protein
VNATRLTSNLQLPRRNVMDDKRTPDPPEDAPVLPPDEEEALRERVEDTRGHLPGDEEIAAIGADRPPPGE